MPESANQDSQEDRLQQAVQMISTAQAASSGEGNSDLPLVVSACNFFDADGCILVLFEQHEPEKVSRKEIGRGSDWKNIGTFKFQKGLLWKAASEKKVLEISDPSKRNDYYREIDEIEGIKPEFLICNPIQSHGKTLGVIALVNPGNYFIQTFDKYLFQLFTNALAGQLLSSRIYNTMQIVDADLQVNRQQLQKSRNTLRILFDNIPESFYLVNTDYQILAINLSRARRTGHLPRELVGRKCHEALFHLSEPCPECLVKETIKFSRSQHLNGHRWEMEKRPRDWDISSYPVLGQNGCVEQIILLEQDITEKKKMENEIIQSERLVAVGQLAAGVAHEINNPLTSILANAQMLLLDLDPSQTELIESVKLIEMAGMRATKVVENLQSMMRREEFDFQMIDLNESIQSALMLVSHEFISRKIAIRFNRGENMPRMVASGDHLQGVWINMLQNAIEAIEKEPGEIKIETLFDEGKFYVEFKDTGAGISEQNLDKIFEPFFTTKKAGRGTGLGLSLARRIINAHGGQILVESAPGQGTRFTLVFPQRSIEEIRKKKGTTDLGLF